MGSTRPGGPRRRRPGQREAPPRPPTAGGQGRPASPSRAPRARLCVRRRVGDAGGDGVRAAASAGPSAASDTATRGPARTGEAAVPAASAWGRRTVCCRRRSRHAAARDAARAAASPGELTGPRTQRRGPRRSTRRGDPPLPRELVPPSASDAAPAASGPPPAARPPVLHSGSPPPATRSSPRDRDGVRVTPMRVARRARHRRCPRPRRRRRAVASRRRRPAGRRPASRAWPWCPGPGARRKWAGIGGARADATPAAPFANLRGGRELVGLPDADSRRDGRARPRVPTPRPGAGAGGGLRARVQLRRTAALVAVVEAAHDFATAQAAPAWRHVESSSSRTCSPATSERRGPGGEVRDPRHGPASNAAADTAPGGVSEQHVVNVGAGYTFARRPGSRG